MRVALLRVGADSAAKSGGLNGPLFADGTFVYVPIPDTSGLDDRTYGTQITRDNQPLIDFFPPTRKEKMRGQSIHLDPEFSTYTYGDPTRPKAGLRWLVKGDLLIFYAGLEGFDHASPPGLYIIGYFEVAFAGRAVDLSEEEISACKDNFHVRHKAVFDIQRERLVLVKGGQGSRMLQKAAKISVMGQDRVGKPLKVLSPEMQQIFGDFDGKLSFQRSPTRWVLPGYVNRAANYVRKLL